jgi:osmoprotectant transport system substrate-binding protein
MSRRVAIAGLIRVLVLAAGLAMGVAACGSSGGGAGTTVATTVTTGVPPGAQTLTQPPVAVKPAIKTAGDKNLPGYGRPLVRLGDMNTDEQFVIGALYKIALQQAGYDVILSRNVGIPSVRLGALKENSLDLYPEYLNEWDRGVAGLTTRFTSVDQAYAAAVTYANKHGFRLLRPTPGGRTDGLAVTTQFARENRLRTLAELKRLPELTFGIPITFSGLWKAERLYSFGVGTRQDILTGNQYSQLTQGAVQVAWVYTTDPQLGLSSYTLLKDTKHVFGFGNIVPVTTPAFLAGEGPDFARIINRIDALLTTTALRGLNAEVVLYGRDPDTVAYQFLEGNGLMPQSRYVVGG